MINNSRDFRMQQIAEMILYRNIPNISLKQSDDNVYDVLCSTTIDGLRFGINVVSSSFSTSNTYEHYLKYLDSVDYSDKNYRIPILLMAVNESTETAMIGIQVGWRFGKPTIFKKPSMMSLTKENSNKILDAVKSMDETIRLLSEYDMKIIKTINLEKSDPNGMNHHARMVYLRDLTEQYKMSPKVMVNERENFNRLLTGIPEEEYPNDFLDDAVLEMVKQKFPNANMKSQRLLFSSELRDLQQLSQLRRFTSEMYVVPNMNSLLGTTNTMPKEFKYVHFGIDVFVDFPFNSLYFENLSFTKFEPIENWLKTINNYSKAIKSLHSPTEFLYNK